MPRCDVLLLFIDDELKGQEREDLICHLKDCASCQEELKEAKVFSARVRGARPKIEAPPALREKILSRMSNPPIRRLRIFWYKKDLLFDPIGGRWLLPLYC